MPTAPIGSSRSERMPPLLLAGVLGTVAMWVVHIVLREVSPHPPGDPIRLLVTTLLVGSVALLIAGQIQLSRAADEFHRQVQFIALSIAFPLALVANVAIGFFAAEGLLAGMDPRDLGSITFFAYLVGYAVARRCYR